MNKYKKILYLLAVFLCFFSFNFYTAFADDDGYYIKNMDVKVDANDKREFKIKETIDVYFNEERHGIIRTIPKEVSFCLLYTSPSPLDRHKSRMPSSS